MSRFKKVKLSDFSKKGKFKNKRKVMVAVPHTGILRTNLAIRLISFIVDAHLHFSFNIPHDSNRNRIVKDFLETGYEWLIMIDSDVVPPHNLINMTHTDKKIVAAKCHAYQFGKNKLVAYKFINNRYLTVNEDDIKGETEVDAVGTGCIAIHRDVFKKLKPPYFKFHYNEDGVMDNGEDLEFCKKAKENGFKIYMNGNFSAKHVVPLVI